MNTICKDEVISEDMVSICGMNRAILDARKALGWSRQVAASYLGISEQSLSRWENGATKKIKPDSYKKLEKVLDGTAKLEDNE